MNTENKPEFLTGMYEVTFVQPDQEHLINGAVTLINHFYEQGLMLPVTPEKYTDLASKGTLVVAKNGLDQVIGTAAYTQFYEKDIWEFGGWAVDQKYQGHGIGIKLIAKLFGEKPHGKTIAFGNKNSGPILESLGAKVIKNHLDLPQEVFKPCALCPNHSDAGCCDTIYHLGNAVVNQAVKNLTPRQIDRGVFGDGEPPYPWFDGWDKGPKDW